MELKIPTVDLNERVDGTERVLVRIKGLVYKIFTTKL